MKKLILLILLFFTFFAHSQEKQQFVKSYTIAMFINSAGEKTEWKNLETRIFFNYGNKNDKVKFYIANNVLNFTQIAETKYDKTKNGLEYAELHLLDDKSGEEIYLQVFKEEIYGVRFIDLNFSVMQLANPIN